MNKNTFRKAAVRKRKKRISDSILQAMIWTFSFITVAVLAYILIYIVSNGIGHISFKFIRTLYLPRKDLYGVLPMIINTLYIIVITIIIATPIGIGAAVYLVEYSKPGKLLTLIHFATETLSGIPSIIYGLFGFMFFNTLLDFSYSILSGALTLSIMVLPTIIRTTEEALRSVPISYKEGSLALGASRLRTISKVILPCAIPGILTAVVLSIGRIVGETAALIFTTGIVFRLPTDIFGHIMTSGGTLSLHLYLLAATGKSFEQSFATATILVIIVAVINLLATAIASRLKKMSMGA